MKQLTCEMCGSTDLLKQDGVFVCQTCGCKYSVEEAKKMMIEGTVDVSGSTVKVDTSDELKNLYELARRSHGNRPNASKYYGMILVKDPDSWEANFYSMYFDAWQGDKPGTSARASIVNGLDSVVQLVSKNQMPESEKVAAVQEINDKTREIADFFWSEAYNRRNVGMSEFINQSVDKIASAQIYRNLGDAIYKYFSMNELTVNLAISAWEKYLETYNKCFGNVTTPPEEINQTNAKIKEAKNQLATVIAQEQVKKKKEQQERNNAYWEAHANEKAALDAELTSIERQIDDANEQIHQIELRFGASLEELRSKRNNKVPAENDQLQCEQRINDLQNQLNSLGIFKGKQKKAVQEQIAEEQEKIKGIRQVVDQQKKEFTAEIDRKIQQLQEPLKPYQDKIHDLSTRQNEIKAELNKDR